MVAGIDIYYSDSCGESHELFTQLLGALEGRRIVCCQSQKTGAETFTRDGRRFGVWHSLTCANGMLADQTFRVFDAPWRKIVNSVESIADAHYNLSDRISKEIEHALRKFATQNREMQGMTTMQGNLSSMAKEFEDAQHASEKLSKKGGKASAQKVENAAAKLQNAEQQWHAQAPFIFESLQALDERRLNHLRDVLTQLETHEADRVERSRVAVEQTLTALLEIDTAHEIRNWSEATTGGRPVTDGAARQLSSAGEGGTGSALPIPPPTPRSTHSAAASDVSKQEGAGGRLHLSYLHCSGMKCNAAGFCDRC